MNDHWNRTTYIWGILEKKGKITKAMTALIF